MVRYSTFGDCQVYNKVFPGFENGFNIIMVSYSTNNSAELIKNVTGLTLKGHKALSQETARLINSFSKFRKWNESRKAKLLNRHLRVHQKCYWSITLKGHSPRDTSSRFNHVFPRFRKSKRIFTSTKEKPPAFDRIPPRICCAKMFQYCVYIL